LNVGLKIGIVNLLFLPADVFGCFSVRLEKFCSCGLFIPQIGIFSFSRAGRATGLKMSLCQFCASLIVVKMSLKVTVTWIGSP